MSFRDIAVPFADSYRSFYVGLGIIGGYIAVLLGLSFYARARIGVATWKKLHRFTIAAYALAVVHSLGAGTDASTAWFQVPLLASAGMVAMMFAIRVATAGRAPTPAQRPARQRRVVTVGERP
jgi:sulfoxide reductase heme-binding subunit YedZ